MYIYIYIYIYIHLCMQKIYVMYAYECLVIFLFIKVFIS